MCSRFAQLLKPPQFSDEGQTRAASVLHIILLTLLVVFAFLAFLTNHPVTIFITAGMSALFLGLWWVMRRGFVQQVSWCLMVILVVGITLIVYFNGSIRVPAAAGFVACTVVAGLTLGNRATIGSVVLISGILFVLYQAESAGKLPPVYYQSTGFLQWATYAGILCITAVLLIQTHSSILTALVLARRNEQALAERNRELHVEIAERQQIEQALRESEARYRTLVSTSPDGIAQTDMQSRIIFASPQLLALSSLQDPGEIIGTHVLDWIVPEDHARAIENVQLAMAGQARAYNHYRFLRRDGSQVAVEVNSAAWHSADGHTGGMISMIRDISERLRAEQALRVSEQKFLLAFQTSPALMAIKRANDETYTEVNQAFLDQLGFERQDVIGKSPLALGLYADPGQREVIAAYLQAHGRVTDLEIAVHTRYGHTLTLLFSAEMIEIEQEAFILTIGHNITERKQAQEALRHLKDDLEQRVAERTAELTATNQELESFSYSVAHDLRTPLRAIDGFSRMLLEDHSAQIDTEGCFYLKRIIAANQRMSRLIDDLLSLSRLARSELGRENVEMSQMACDILSEFALNDPERVVEWVVTDGMIVSADPHMLRIVLENLLGNAWKFTAKSKPARVEFGIQPGKTIVYFVRDNGVGFDMTYANKLFEAFQRLHATNEFPGSGIGLATVKRIIQRHGGAVWATGEVNGGSTFFFTLP